MFKIYSSSAGSGKTYALTREYLKLALHPDNDSYYRHILAVTFTNAAAQEMKARILGTLRIFSEGNQHPMMTDIARELYPDIQPGSEPFQLKLLGLRERSSRIFTRILHGYSDFSVMTIDSFMSRLVGSFTDELGLPFGFETRLDSDLLTEAIDRLLARIGVSGEETLTRLLENYYLEHARDEGAWGALPQQMVKVASDLLNEQSYLAMSRVSDLSLDDWQQIRKHLSAFINEKEAGIRNTAANAFGRIQDAGLTPADFFQSKRGIYGYFAGRAQPAAGKLWEAPNSYVIKTIDEDKWYSAKKSPTLERISPDLKEAFLAIEKTREAFAGFVVLFRSLAAQLYSLSLLNEIKREFDYLLRQNNQVHISDFNRKVMDIVANDPVPFIFERLGEKYNHILIDEFQDTSKLQFANLLPLIDNALSNGYFNLIVGDVKQAIYRFRGGDMELLLKLSSRQAGQIASLFETGNPFMTDRLALLNRNAELARLVTNRRSFSEITSFNNGFFHHLSTAGPTGTPLTVEVYDEHFQQESGPGAPSGGHVQIDFFEKPDTEETSPDTETTSDPELPGLQAPDLQGAHVLSLIPRLREEGYHWRDIAILCRYKKNSAQLAVWLRDAGMPLISDDSLLLSNSLSIELIIRFIRVIHNPGNAAQRLETLVLAHRVVLKTVIDGLKMEQIVSISKMPAIESFLSYFSGYDLVFDAAEIYQLGIYELCEQIAARMKLFDTPSESPYLFRFLDEVLKFENTRISHLGDFLSWWETSGNRLSITVSGDADAIRITTIHKSKGLEYPVVLFPYADWKATPKPGSRMWVNLDHVKNQALQSDGKRLLSAAIPLTKTLAETPAGDQYREEVDRVLLENINLTYVAFTRPVQRLYILAGLPVPFKNSSTVPPPSVNLWLQSYLKELGQWEDDRRQYVLSRANSAPVHAHTESPARPFYLDIRTGNRQATTLSLKRNADKIFQTPSFEREQDILQKLRQVLIQLPSGGALSEVVRKNILAGLLRPEDEKEIIQLASRILTDPVMNLFWDPGTSRISSELILTDGDILEADRVALTHDGIYHILLFASEATVSYNHIKIKRLLRSYGETGQSTFRGYVVNLSTSSVERFT